MIYMYIIAGLGNPTKEYEHTRHNMGFDVIDKLADKIGINSWSNKYEATCAMAMIGIDKVLLLKPQTYMNSSGISISEAVRFYKESIDHVIVAYDDIDLDVGRLRIRKNGSAGGHNGIKSIISHLGSSDFSRVRVGVGAKPKGYDLADYVLGKPSSSEAISIDKACDDAADAIICIIEYGIDKAMNIYNIHKDRSSSDEI